MSEKKDRKVALRLFKEKSIERFFQVNGIFSIIVLLGIFSLLLIEGWPAIRELGIAEFLFNTKWNPTSFVKENYGILSMVISTLMVTIGAMIIAVPLGIGCAAYLSDVASKKTREIVKPIIEILAGIPSVVIGFIGIIIVGPFLAKLLNTSHGLNAINGSILLAVMSLPTIISISEDAITSVPKVFKQASYALGANKWQTLIKVTLPAAMSGIIASVMLGMGRAIGETMTVLMACGNAPAFPESIKSSVRPITSTIAIEMGETVQGGLHYSSLFVVAFVLFLMTFAVNLVSDIVLNKYQKVNR